MFHDFTFVHWCRNLGESILVCVTSPIYLECSGVYNLRGIGIPGYEIVGGGRLLAYLIAIQPGFTGRILGHYVFHGGNANTPAIYRARGSFLLGLVLVASHLISMS